MSDTKNSAFCQLLFEWVHEQAFENATIDYDKKVSNGSSGGVPSSKSLFPFMTSSSAPSSSASVSGLKPHRDWIAAVASDFPEISVCNLGAMIQVSVPLQLLRERAAKSMLVLAREIRSTSTHPTAAAAAAAAAVETSKRLNSEDKDDEKSAAAAAAAPTLPSLNEQRHQERKSKIQERAAEIERMWRSNRVAVVALQDVALCLLALRSVEQQQQGSSSSSASSSSFSVSDSVPEAWRAMLALVPPSVAAESACRTHHQSATAGAAAKSGSLSRRRGRDDETSCSSFSSSSATPPPCAACVLESVVPLLRRAGAALETVDSMTVAPMTTSLVTDEWLHGALGLRDLRSSAIEASLAVLRSFIGAAVRGGPGAPTRGVHGGSSAPRTECRDDIDTDGDDQGSRLGTSAAAATATTKRKADSAMETDLNFPSATKGKQKREKQQQQQRRTESITNNNNTSTVKSINNNNNNTPAQQAPALTARPHSNGRSDLSTLLASRQASRAVVARAAGAAVLGGTARALHQIVPAPSTALKDRSNKNTTLASKNSASKSMPPLASASSVSFVQTRRLVNQPSSSSSSSSLSSANNSTSSNRKNDIIDREIRSERQNETAMTSSQVLSCKSPSPRKHLTGVSMSQFTGGGGTAGAGVLGSQQQQLGDAGGLFATGRKLLFDAAAGGAGGRLQNLDSEDDTGDFDPFIPPSP